MKQRTGSFLVWGASLMLVAAGGYLVFSKESSGPERRDFGRATPVATQPVSEAAFADVIEAIGTTRANESVILTARVSETVQRVNFQDGMRVEKGAILVELTNFEEVAIVRERQAAVLEAEQQFERIQNLVKSGNASRATLDQRVRNLEETRARLAAAQARVDDRIIRAPFSGILGLRNVSEGAFVSPGTEITTLDDIHIIKLDFSVPERFISVLKVGEKIISRAEAFAGLPFTGTILTVNSRVDPVTRAVTVRAVIPNPEAMLRPGMLLTVSLASNVRTSLAVSESAVIPVGRETFVFVLEEDLTVRRVQVTIGARLGGMVEITSGLEAGQNVVTSGTMRLRTGSKVRLPSAQGAKDGRGDARRRQKKKDGGP